VGKADAVAHAVADNINRGRANQPAVVLDGSNNALLYSIYHSTAGGEVLLEVRHPPDAYFDFLTAADDAESRRLDVRGIRSVFVAQIAEQTRVAWRDPRSGFVVSLEGSIPAPQMTELVRKVECA